MPQLKIPPDTAIHLLSAKLDEIEEIFRTGRVLEYYDFVGWCSQVWSVIDDIYAPECSYPEEIRNMGVPRCTCSGSTEVQRMLLEEYHNRLMRYLEEIQDWSEKQEMIER